MSIRLEHVNYVYGADTELSVAALKDVCLTIEDGEFVGLIGHTGSGKSTLTGTASAAISFSSTGISGERTSGETKAFVLEHEMLSKMIHSSRRRFRI